MEINSNQILPNNFLFFDQTILVNALYAIDRWADEDEREEVKQLEELTTINDFVYPVETSTGVLIIPDHPYDVITDELKHIVAGYERNEKDLDPVARMKFERIKVVKGIYELAEGYFRPVYSWWQVPYWFGDLLIEKGEVVLRGYGSTWWGITDKAIIYPGTAELIKNLYAELIYIKNHAPGERYCQYRLYSYVNREVSANISGMVDKVLEQQAVNQEQAKWQSSEKKEPAQE